MLHDASDGNIEVVCCGQAWTVHAQIINQCQVLYDKLEFETASKLVGTITLNDFESFECMWILEYLYQGGREYPSHQHRPDFQRWRKQTANANTRQTGLSIDRASKINPTESILETAVRLCQIATHLKLNKLADYAQVVFVDYLDLIWCHQFEKGLTRKEKSSYNRSIYLAGRALGDRVMDKTSETLINKLSVRVSDFLDVETGWLNDTIASLRKEVPMFKQKYDWLVGDDLGSRWSL